MNVEKCLATVYVRDLESCAAWYQNLFARKHDKAPNDDCRQWELVKDSFFQVLTMAGHPASSSVAFVVPSLANEKDRLAKIGITLDQFLEYPNFARTAAARDPEGNTVTLVEAIGEA